MKLLVVYTIISAVIGLGVGCIAFSIWGSGEAFRLGLVAGGRGTFVCLSMCRAAGLSDNTKQGG